MAVTEHLPKLLACHRARATSFEDSRRPTYSRTSGRKNDPTSRFWTWPVYRFGSTMKIPVGAPTMWSMLAFEFGSLRSWMTTSSGQSSSIARKWVHLLRFEPGRHRAMARRGKGT